MDIILAIGSFNAFVFAYLVFNKANKEQPDKILFYWMILFGVNLLNAFLTLKVGFPGESILAIFASAFYIAHFPFLYIYTKSITIFDFQIHGKELLHFSPVILMLTGSLPLLHLNPIQQKLLANSIQRTPWYFVFTELVFTVTFIVYIANTARLLQKHKQRIKNTFSYEERVNLAWLRHIVIGFISLLLLTIVVFALSNLHLFNVVETDEVLYLGLALMVLYIGYWGHKQGKIFYYAEPQFDETEDSIVVTKDKTEKSNVAEMTAEPKAKKTLESLLHFMKEEKLYLDPELNIITLSIKLNMHPHNLSKLINIHLQQNFFDFINQYRVEEFKSLALNDDYKHYSLLAIAFEAGFNSKASFNRIFKNTTGYTPSQYIKNKSLHYS